MSEVGIMRWSPVVFVVLVVLLSGCGSVDSATESATSTSASRQITESTSTAVTAPEPESTTATSTAALTTTTVPASTTTTPITTTTHTPAEPIPAPPEGSEWMVVGIEANDVLHVRDGPGVTHPVVGTLEPTTEGIVANGVAFLVGRSIWWEVVAPMADGWVNSLYLAAAGETDDVTSSIVADFGTIPSAPTLHDLAELVVEVRAPEGARVVVAADATVSAGISEMSVDIFPAEPDDSVGGERLHIFGQRDGTTGPIGLYSVEATPLCWRGADAAGLCV